MSDLTSERFVLNIRKEITIKAPPATVFDSILEQIGPGFTLPNGEPSPMKIEPWPGGRWLRDLGNNAGHWWASVQVIKPPTLLELAGPMFMSYAVAGHVQYRVKATDGGSLLTLVHTAFGDISPDHRKGVDMGWDYILSGIGKRATR